MAFGSLLRYIRSYELGGIAEDELDKIFERFHRVKSTSRSHEGSGIGLALTHELVKLMYVNAFYVLTYARSRQRRSGTLEVTSTIDVGSTFSVRVPLGFGHLPPERVSHEQAPLVNLLTPPRRDLAYVEQVEAWRVDSTVSPPASTAATSETPSSGEESYLLATDITSYKNEVVLVVDDKSVVFSFQAFRTDRICWNIARTSARTWLPFYRNSLQSCRLQTG